MQETRVLIENTGPGTIKVKGHLIPVGCSGTFTVTDEEEILIKSVTTEPDGEPYQPGATDAENRLRRIRHRANRRHPARQGCEVYGAWAYLLHMRERRDQALMRPFQAAS